MNDDFKEIHKTLKRDTKPDQRLQLEIIIELDNLLSFLPVNALHSLHILYTIEKLNLLAILRLLSFKMQNLADEQ